ncbi:MAG: hydrogenase, partial [Chloroflexaceae bacterium]|nr:hydrogenase [Chloroflexaceae bacterium]
IWDYSLYLGTFGLFFTLFLLFIRLLPMINIFEMRLMLFQEREREHILHQAANEGDQGHGGVSPAHAD